MTIEHDIQWVTWLVSPLNFLMLVFRVASFCIHIYTLSVHVITCCKTSSQSSSFNHSSPSWKIHSFPNLPTYQSNTLNLQNLKTSPPKYLLITVLLWYIYFINIAQYFTLFVDTYFNTVITRSIVYLS